MGRIGLNSEAFVALSLSRSTRSRGVDWARADRLHTLIRRKRDQAALIEEAKYKEQMRQIEKKKLKREEVEAKKKIKEQIEADKRARKENAKSPQVATFGSDQYWQTSGPKFGPTRYPAYRSIHWAGFGLR